MMQIEVGAHVHGGKGEDHDIGVVQKIDGDRAFVAWQSGVSTWTPLDEIEEADE